MQRRKFDLIVAWLGLFLAVIMGVAGGLLAWGGDFATRTVHEQLAAQKIFFPPAGSEALAPAEIGKYLNKYAGQQLTTGEQAEAYANHFIAAHLSEIGGGKSYAELSAASRQDPTNTALQGQVATVFRGETLRGLLLNAYAFGTLGNIAGIASTVMYVAAGVLLLLALLGLRHARTVDADVRL